MSLSLTLRRRQIDKAHSLRRTITDCVDYLYETWLHRDLDEIQYDEHVDFIPSLVGKSQDYREFALKSAVSYLKYLRTTKRIRSQGELVNSLFFPRNLVKFDIPRSNILFPECLGLEDGFLNYFDFNIFLEAPESCVDYSRLTFPKGLIFCELKTHPFNIDWDRLGQFDLYEVLPKVTKNIVQEN